MLRALTLLIAAAFLAACGSTANQVGATATAQQFAGITEMTITCYDPADMPGEVVKLYENKAVACVLDKAQASTGKEYENVDLSVDLAKGTVTFKASKVAGFSGQAIRSAAEQAFAESESATVRALGPALTEALVKALVPTP